MRMYSFFSRHEVDKKATGFNSGEEGFPSPGRVAWDLWGGDAGFSWSRQKAASIKNKRTNKMSSIWDGAFLGTLGKEQVEAANAEALVDLEEENDEPLEPEIVTESSAPAETPAPVAETPAEPVVETPAENVVIAESAAPAPAETVAPAEEPAAPAEAPAEEAPATEQTA